MQACDQRELFTRGSSILVLAILGCVWSCGCAWRQVSHSGTVYIVLFVFLREDWQPWESVCRRVQLWDYEHVPPHPFSLYRYSSGPHVCMASIFANSAIHPWFLCAKNEDAVENKQVDISNLLISRQLKIPANLICWCQFCWTYSLPALVVPS